MLDVWRRTLKSYAEVIGLVLALVPFHEPGDTQFFQIRNTGCKERHQEVQWPKRRGKPETFEPTRNLGVLMQRFAMPLSRSLFLLEPYLFEAFGEKVICLCAVIDLEMAL